MFIFLSVYYYIIGTLWQMRFLYIFQNLSYYN